VVGSLLKGANGLPIPSWGLVTKTVQFQGKIFTSSFLHTAVAGPIWALILEKVQNHCRSRDQPNHVCFYGSGPTRRQTLSAYFF
jgi:hypothetical protein